MFLPASAAPHALVRFPVIGIEKPVAFLFQPGVRDPLVLSIKERAMLLIGCLESIFVSTSILPQQLLARVDGIDAAALQGDLA